MPSELVNFLTDCLSADSVSNFAGYFFRKDFFWIHANRDQIDLREDNRYESRIIIQNLFQTGGDAGTPRHSSPYLFSDREKYSKQPLSILGRIEKEG